jgi:UDP-hydrolysing UDP-N-acetyl-D-glucosamine 2-epimerase
MDEKAPTIDILEEFDDEEFQKKRILIWVGGRANYGRLKVLIYTLSQVHTVELIIGDYEVPNHYVIAGRVPNLMYSDSFSNSARSVSLVIQGVTTILESRGSYDLAIVHADRFENLGFAIACSYCGIPLLHTEGGEESGQIDNKVRNAITSLADYHCAATELAYKKLICRGCNAIFAGSPAIDYIREIGYRTCKRDYVLAVFNPSDTDDYTEFIAAISNISEVSPVLWVPPANDPGWREIAKDLHRLSNIFLMDKLTPYEYYDLLSRARVLVGNTSSGIKEGCYLGIPYVLVGDRQIGREVGPNVTKVPCKHRDIFNAVEDIQNGCRYEYNGMFGDGHSCEKILKYIDSEVFGE